MQILVVDDDALAGEMTAAVLESEGYQVVLAESAVEAIEQLNAHPELALIISDMNMPMISGIELYQELKEQGNGLPFILLSGDDPAQAAAREPGLSACVTKDFNLEETLPRVVTEVMSQAGRSQS